MQPSCVASSQLSSNFSVIVFGIFDLTGHVMTEKKITVVPRFQLLFLSK